MSLSHPHPLSPFPLCQNTGKRVWRDEGKEGRRHGFTAAWRGEGNRMERAGKGTISRKDIEEGEGYRHFREILKIEK